MNTYPTYRSPIRTFEELGISTDSIDSNQLKFEKKRLLLEIQISDSQTTTIGDKELSKNDVIELFNELEQITHLEYHKAIFHHPKLLYLLESARVSSIKIEKHHKIRFDTPEEWNDFIAFISPYLTDSIDKLLSKIIRKSNFKELEEIQSFFKLLTKTDRFYAFRKMNNFCETLGDRLEHLAYSRTTFPAEEVQYLRSPAFYNLANELADTFPNMPNSVAHAVINFTVNCERKVGRKKMLVEISDQARRLHCDAKMKSLIINNRDAFYESREQVLGYNPNGVWRALVAVVVVLIMVFRVTSRCDSSRDYANNSDYQYLLEQYGTPQTSGEAYDFDESYFSSFHKKVVKATETSGYVNNYNISQGEPRIISPFKKAADSTGLAHTVSNETPSDMVMVICEGSTLRSHYIPSEDSIRIQLKKTSSAFFYSGKNWGENRTIQHLFFSQRTGKPHIIFFNGYFQFRTDKDDQFVKKLFTITYGLPGNFTIRHELDGYEFYHEGLLVNYSI